MISFISTFPPIICGIGTYMKYNLEHIPASQGRVISFDVGEFPSSSDVLSHELVSQVDYCLSFSSMKLPSIPNDDLIWFQHAFGMWGNKNDYFINLIHEAKGKGHKVVVSFHTIHFQSDETVSGISKIEEELLKEALPLVDALTLFTDGAKRAVIESFPEYDEKIVVLRHGVHQYPKIDHCTATKKFFSYMVNEDEITLSQKRELFEVEKYLYSADSVLLGNYGFITSEKDPLQIYELGRLVQERLPKHRVITLFAGIIQKRKDIELETYLEALRSKHDGKWNFFFEVYIPENIFPFAFRALDFAGFWCQNGTQSGRMAHAQGTRVLAVGRDCEGIGETLRLSGLPCAESLSELADIIAELVLEPSLRKEAEDNSWKYAQLFSYANQAKKHLLIENALARGIDLPVLDTGEMAKIRNQKLKGIYKSHHLVPFPVKESTSSGGKYPVVT